MTDRPFLDAICQNPEEDTPRLVYADWLVEHGQLDRGEFIRVQCELTRRVDEGSPAHGGTKCLNPKLVVPINGYGEQFPNDAWIDGCRACELCVLNKRSNILLSNKEKWFLPWSRMQRSGVFTFAPMYQFDGYEYERGFVEFLSTYADQWFAHGDAILREHPVQDVFLKTLPGLQGDTIETAELIGRDIFGPGGPSSPIAQNAHVRMMLGKRWPTIKMWSLPRDEDRQ